MKVYSHGERYNVSGIRIRERREMLGLTQEQLAAKLQVQGLEASQKVVSRVETGARVVPDYELRYYAKALGVELLWLLEESPA